MTSKYTPYNARWLSPEQVAHRFVPVPQFRSLVRPESALLMGPRGCGKTTLLKMLTPKALRAWSVTGRSEAYPEVTFPEFLAVYVPSDIRWSSELNAIGESGVCDVDVANRLQRLLVLCNSTRACLECFQACSADTIGNVVECERQTCTAVIRLLKLRECIPIYADAKQAIELLSAEISGLVNVGTAAEVTAFLAQFSPAVFADVTDAAIRLCGLVDELTAQSHQWALCYDEVEIAPGWMQQELLASLRSVEQRVILKLTWSPILPEFQGQDVPEIAADYTGIRLWYSHIQDPLPFCEALTAQFLKEKFPDDTPSAGDLLGTSVFASEGEEDDPCRTYARDSVVHRAMVELAEKDETFRLLLVDKGIDPTDPVPDEFSDGSIRDTLFRKIKPIVLLRNEFLFAPGHRRGRKRTTLYAGKQAVFGVSEGNPRRLLTLLNDIYDLSITRGRKEGLSRFRIPYGQQAPIVHDYARKLVMRIKTEASGTVSSGTLYGGVLWHLVEDLGKRFSWQLYGGAFPLDPVASFDVDKNVSAELKDLISQGLRVGALIHVAGSTHDVPARVEEERFRLSFALAPIFNLALRNYRSIALMSELLSKQNKYQLDFDFGDEDET